MQLSKSKSSTVTITMNHSRRMLIHQRIFSTFGPTLSSISRSTTLYSHKNPHSPHHIQQSLSLTQLVNLFCMEFDSIFQEPPQDHPSYISRNHFLENPSFKPQTQIHKAPFSFHRHHHPSQYFTTPTIASLIFKTLHL